MTKNNYIVDYYFTKKSEKIGEYDKYDVVEKYKMPAYSSDNELGDRLDIFISRNNFTDIKPTSHDLIFFKNEKKFYQALKVEDAGEFYIIDAESYKSR